MVKERNYLIETLKSSGIKSQVYTNMKKLKQGNEVHVGAVLRNGETFTRSGSKKEFCRPRGGSGSVGSSCGTGAHHSM